MNKLLPICLLIFLFAAPVCRAQTKEWQEYTLPDGQFVVSMPAKPTSQSIPLNGSLNGLVAHFLALDKDDESYAVSYIEFPTPLADSSKTKLFLDGFADKEVTKVGGKLISQTDIEIIGYPGRELRIEVADGFWADRVYLVGKRLYLLSAFAVKTTATSKEISDLQNAVIRKYFDSFKLKLEPR